MIQIIVMLHRLGNTITGDQVRHSITYIRFSRQIFCVLHDFGTPVAQLAQQIYLLSLGSFQMPPDNPFLRMPQAQIFGYRNYVLDLIHIQIASRTVIMFQNGQGCLIPLFEHLVPVGVIRVEVDTALGTTNRRTANTELHFHNLGQRDYFSPGEALSHAGSTSGSTVSQRVNDDPALGAGFLIVPFKHDLGLFLLVFAQE